MTALSEALRPTKDAVINALRKAYIAGTIDQDAVVTGLEAIGETDVTDREQFLNALDILHNLGAPAPQPTAPRDAENEPASEAQEKFIARLAEDRGVVAPDYKLSKANASKVIEELKAGTYNADSWSVPF